MIALIELRSERCTIQKRLNRFVVEVAVNGTTGLASLNNTGRLQEYIFLGSEAYCMKRERPKKTAYELIAVQDGPEGAALINTRLQMLAFERAIALGLLPWAAGCAVAKRSPRLRRSVLDYLLNCGGSKVMVEVKSAVMRGPGDVAMYPDCRSERGERQLRDIISALKDGIMTAVVFIAALPGAKAFTPNSSADPEIKTLLAEARASGSMIKAISMHYDGRAVQLDNPDLPVII